jgi:hypothetical protein
VQRAAFERLQEKAGRLLRPPTNVRSLGHILGVLIDYHCTQTPKSVGLLDRSAMHDRIPVPIHLTEIPADVLISAGTTCTVVFAPHPCGIAGNTPACHRLVANPDNRCRRVD